MKTLTWSCVSALLILTACGTAPGEDAPPDGADAAVFADGKADSIGFSDCELDAIVSLVNRSTVEDLKSVGVHTRAAKNLVAGKVGDDGKLGTEDDLAYPDAKAIDAVKYVGPVAFTTLVDAVRPGCQTSVPDEISVIFSPQAPETSHLRKVAELIDGAQSSLDIAMYSFSDTSIRSSIEAAIERGVQVRMIFESANKDRRDPDGSRSARLEELGVDVRYINKIMHHKWVIIDGPRDVLDRADTATLVSGSANWSNSAATRYDENTVIVRGQRELNLRFQREFNLLWRHSRDFEWGVERDLELSTLEITEEMIGSDDTVDASFTSENFRTFFSSRFGQTFSRVRGRSAVAEMIVARIEAAQDSIHIASGHLRSRPIAEALIAKRTANPEMKIRVYLDGQEFISRTTDRIQHRKLDACLEAAGTSASRREDCIDKGFYFGLELHDAGIDVRYKHYSYRWHYKTAAQMHHKYLIIDDAVIQGSYNLSDNAEHNTMENMIVFQGPTYKGLHDDFMANFEAMWETGRAEDLLGSLNQEIETSSTRIPIVYDSMSLTWDEVDDLKRLIRTTCPAVNSQELRENPDKHFTCEL